MDYINISRKTVEQAEVLERVIRGELSQEEAGALLKLTSRSIRRKLTRYGLHGIEGLRHGNKGKPSPRKTTEENVLLLVKLLEEKLQDAGPTFLAEKLLESEGVKLSHEVVRQILIGRGKWVVNSKRPVHRIRRPRRARLGMLIQLDGSPHDWFEGRGPRCTLLVFIDDATSAILWLHFVTGESVEEVMQATKQYLEKEGRPLSFYVDYGSVWSVNVNNPERDKLTQFERAMKELGIDVIHARSPQAKGRVERANKTLQDRLVKEMRLRGISSMDEANTYVRDIYLAQHNARFEVAPAEHINMHRSLDSFDLYNILAIREERVIQNDYVVQYCKKLFHLAAEQSTIIRPKDRVVVSRHLDGAISVSIRKTKLAFTVVDKRPEKPVPIKIYKPAIPTKPSENHPWRGKFACPPSLQKST